MSHKLGEIHRQELRFDHHTRAVVNLVTGLDRSTTSSTGDLNASKVHLEGSAGRETNAGVEEMKY